MPTTRDYFIRSIYFSFSRRAGRRRRAEKSKRKNWFLNWSRKEEEEGDGTGVPIFQQPTWNQPWGKQDGAHTVGIKEGRGRCPRERQSSLYLSCLKGIWNSSPDLRSEALQFELHHLYCMQQNKCCFVVPQSKLKSIAVNLTFTKNDSLTNSLSHLTLTDGVYVAPF